jgi:hypothetical protein
MKNLFRTVCILVFYLSHADATVTISYNSDFLEFIKGCITIFGDREDKEEKDSVTVPMRVAIPEKSIFSNEEILKNVLKNHWIKIVDSFKTNALANYVKEQKHLIFGPARPTQDKAANDAMDLRALMEARQKLLPDPSKGFLEDIFPESEAVLQEILPPSGIHDASMQLWTSYVTFRKNDLNNFVAEFSALGCNPYSPKQTESWLAGSNHITIHIPAAPDNSSISLTHKNLFQIGMKTKKSETGEPIKEPYDKSPLTHISDSSEEVDGKKVFTKKFKTTQDIGTTEFSILETSPEGRKELALHISTVAGMHVNAPNFFCSRFVRSSEMEKNQYIDTGKSRIDPPIKVNSDFLTYILTKAHCKNESSIPVFQQSVYLGVVVPILFDASVKDLHFSFLNKKNATVDLVEVFNAKTPHNNFYVGANLFTRELGLTDFQLQWTDTDNQPKKVILSIIVGSSPTEESKLTMKEEVKNKDNSEDPHTGKGQSGTSTKSLFPKNSANKDE